MIEQADGALNKALSSGRRPRVLWASLSCLLDTTNGAALSVRQALRQLAGAGFDIDIVGAVNFASENGKLTFLTDHAARTVRDGSILRVQDGPLTHALTATTVDTFPAALPAEDQDRWRRFYRERLQRFRPDLVWFFGKGPLNDVIPATAHALGIPTAAYGATHTLAHVDTVLFDSRANAKRYDDLTGCNRAVVGLFVDPAGVVAESHRRERVTFFNPILAKGAAIVVVLAWLLERRRPDILFEVVQSRGDWHAVLNRVTTALGDPRDRLRNVIVTPNRGDVAAIYGRARLIIAPSLWFETGSRVSAEAMLNGIPVIATNRGGHGEMIGDGGLLFDLADRFHRKPYLRYPEPKALEPLARTIEAWFDDETAYRALVDKADRVGKTRHRLADNTARLIKALRPLVDRRAGDRIA